MLVHAIILALIVFIRVFYNHTRLRSIPGPVFAGVSGLWRGYVQKLPSYRQTLSELHQRHGQVVRIGLTWSVFVTLWLLLGSMVWI